MSSEEFHNLIISGAISLTVLEALAVVIPEVVCTFILQGFPRRAKKHAVFTLILAIFMAWLTGWLNSASRFLFPTASGVILITGIVATCIFISLRFYHFNRQWKAGTFWNYPDQPPDF